MLKGIDVYDGDGAIASHKVADDGNEFVSVRGTCGSRFKGRHAKLDQYLI